MDSTKDHDVLIELNANFKTFVRQYALDMKKLTDGTATQLADHELRLRSVEDLIEKIQPEKRVVEIEKNTKFREKFMAQVSTIFFIGSFVMYFVMQYISNFINSFLK